MRVDRSETFSALLDKLGERLACGQLNTGLLDALARKHQRQGISGAPLSAIERFRAEELAHVRLIERTLRFLGGSGATPSPSAQAVAASAGALQRVAQDSAVSFAASLEALLLAELRDALGWELLIPLAEGSRLDWLAWEFRGALLEAQEHVRAVRGWLSLPPAAPVELYRRAA
jgi:hypothetical protein